MIGRINAQPRSLVLVGTVAAAALVLILAYVAMGGGRYDPLRVANPCDPREWRSPQGSQEVAEQVTLSALDGAACDLGVSREELALAIANEDDFAAFLGERGIDQGRAEAALRRGMERAIDDAARAGAINGFEEFALRQVVPRLPAGRLLQAVRDGDLNWLGALVG